MPSFEFNSLTGRLQESKSFQALNPIPPKPLLVTEGSAMIYDSIKTKPVTNVSSRAMASGTTSGKLPAKMLKTMEEYQRKINTPVYIIRGTPDKILFGFTAVSVTVSAIWALSYLYSCANPKKN